MSSSLSGIINCQCSLKEKGGLPSLSFIHNGMLKGWILCVSTHLSWFHESSGFVMSRIKTLWQFPFLSSSYILPASFSTRFLRIGGWAYNSQFFNKLWICASTTTYWGKKDYLFQSRCFLFHCWKFLLC